MKEIKAFLRPHMMDTVVDAIERLPGAPGLTVSRVRGFGHRAERGPARMTDRIKLEIVLPDDDVERVLAILLDHARTGRTGDGKVFIVDLVDAVRVRTGERGEAAVRPSEEEPVGGSEA